MSRPVRLHGIVQPYDWGGFDFIAELTGAPRGRNRPMAELWLGAHPLAPARVVDGGGDTALDEAIARAPDAALGPAARRFGGVLPYLLKVLDVRGMLSIQAHPTRQQAREGYGREQAAGVPLDAPNRNYRDENHKPEAVVALTEFWALQGFRPLAEIRALLDARPPLHPLLDWLPGEAGAPGAAPLRALYQRLLLAAHDEVDAWLDPWLRQLEPRYAAGALDPGSPDYWAARAAVEFAREDGRRDRGILSIYLLNLVRLAPGQGSFVGPGLLHAYLQGTGVEIMSASDNVLRGGLTRKHVDMGELLRIVRFVPTDPVVLAGEDVSPWERLYATPAEEFALTRVRLDPGARLPRTARHGPDTLLVSDGAAVLEAAGERMPLARGDAAFVPAGTSYALESDGGAVAFRAEVPPA